MVQGGSGCASACAASPMFLQQTRPCKAHHLLKRAKLWPPQLAGKRDALPKARTHAALPLLLPAAFATGALYATPLPFRLRYIDYLSELYFMDSAVEEALTLNPATSSAQAGGLEGAQLLSISTGEMRDCEPWRLCCGTDSVASERASPLILCYCA